MSTELELTRKFDISTDDPIRVGDPDAWSILVVTATTGVYSVQIVPTNTEITAPAPVEFDRQGAETEAQIVAALAALITARAAAETNDSPQGDLHEYVEAATSSGDELLVVVRQGAPKHRVTSTPPGGTADVSPDSIFPLTVYMVLDTEGHHVTEVEITAVGLDVDGGSLSGTGTFYDVEVRRVLESDPANILVDRFAGKELGASFRSPFNGGRLSVSLTGITPGPSTDSILVLARPVLGSGLVTNISSAPSLSDFDSTVFDTAVRGPNGGPVWRIYTMFAELQNVGLASQTIQSQGGTTIYPATAGIVTLVAGATDTPAGTGASSVLLRGVGAGFVGSTNPLQTWQEEVVELNGTNPVVSTQGFLRVHQALVVDAGTSKTNDGTVVGSIGGNIQIQIDPGVSISKSSYLPIPAGYNAFVSGINVNWAASQPVRVECLFEFGGVEIQVLSANYERSITTPVGVVGFPPAVDTWCRAARVGGGGTDPIDIGVTFLLKRIV